jgi:fatty-acyl-CoA synthase/long-chain acyl-CoA synthetase
MNPVDGESRVGSIGLRLPWQDMRAMLLDAEGALVREAGIDEIGSICISGPNVFPGYLSEEHNKGIWVNTRDADGRVKVWLNTGDLGRMDADGYFWLTGRKKELIIRGGHNIDPKTIEEVLAAHPSVALCAAIGRPDAHAGEVPVAYVQLRAGASASEAELLAHASAHISERAALPKSITAMDLLPVTAVGKIFKPALIMREIELVLRQEAGAAAVTLDELKVEQDPKLGMVARYRLAGVTAPERALAFADAIGKHIFRSIRLD